MEHSSPDKKPIEIHYSARGELSGGAKGINRVITISNLPYSLAGALNRQLYGMAPEGTPLVRDVRGVASVEWTGLDAIKISLTDADATYQILQWFRAFRRRAQGS